MMKKFVTDWNLKDQHTKAIAIQLKENRGANELATKQEAEADKKQI